MLDRWIEDGLLDVLKEEGVGCITFSSLAQGLLTNKYLNGIPENSRAASNRGNGAVERSAVTEALQYRLRQLNDLAGQRGQSLAQMSLSWVLKDPRVTSVIIGASRSEQIIDSLNCLNSRPFTTEELQFIDRILQGT